MWRNNFTVHSREISAHLLKEIFTMNIKSTLILAAVALAALQTSPAMAGDNSKSARASTQEAEAIAAVGALLKNYERMLNAADAEGVAKLYTEDAVFMAPNYPPSVGLAQVTGAYKGVFSQIVPNLTFKIAEIKVLPGGWAMARSTSSGSIKIVANGATAPDAYQELFMLKNVDKQWKIARYSFSTTQAAAK